MLEIDLVQMEGRVPLNPHWKIIEKMDRRISCGSNELHLFGLVGEREGDSAQVIGSAGGETPCLERAYYELIERMAILDAEKNHQGKFDVKDPTGHKLYAISGKDLFTPPSVSTDLRYAKSNGVAVGSDFQSACEASFFELVERDQILGAWYGHTAPKEIKFSNSWLESLSDQYSIHTYQFGDFHQVIGIFAFPKNKTKPFAFGFGAHFNFHDASKKALNEFRQRLGFLWEEVPMETTPDFTPSPSFHQDYYLIPENYQKIRLWLQGKIKCEAPIKRPENPVRLGFSDITPPHLKGQLFVVKAVGGDFIPLVYGRGHPWVSNLHSTFLYHPIP